MNAIANVSITENLQTFVTNLMFCWSTHLTQAAERPVVELFVGEISFSQNLADCLWFFGIRLVEEAMRSNVVIPVIEFINNWILQHSWKVFFWKTFQSKPLYLLLAGMSTNSSFVRPISSGTLEIEPLRNRATGSSIRNRAWPWSRSITGNHVIIVHCGYSRNSIKLKALAGFCECQIVRFN